MNDKIAPKSNVIGVADSISLTGKAESQDALMRVNWEASGVGTAGMQPKDCLGTREIR